jgi:hypothetical protein
VKRYPIPEGTKNDLDTLWAEGSVHVHQEPDSPDNRGVDIQGDTLKLEHKGDGNFLVVTAEDWAHLRLDKIYIAGPEVNIDQSANTAWVNGTGCMKMESATNFQGDKLDRTVPLTIYWGESMVFTGRRAVFEGGPGGIQAEQENALLRCQSMQVNLDRPVSFKEGAKGDQPARVQHLVCDKNVDLEDSTKDAKGLLTRYQRIRCPELSVDNTDKDGQVNAAGPGTVRLYQPGSSDLTVPGPTSADEKKAPGNKPADEEMKLTYISYVGKMIGNNQKRTASFFQDVKVFHVPATSYDLKIDLERLPDPLPEGAMYLTCEELKVSSTPDNGKSNQEMTALRRVAVQVQEFSARADKMTYNEAKDQIILESDQGLVVVYRRVVRGKEFEKITGKKIIYSRKTGIYDIVRSDGVKVEIR